MLINYGIINRLEKYLITENIVIIIKRRIIYICIYRGKKRSISDISHLGFKLCFHAFSVKLSIDYISLQYNMEASCITTCKIVYLFEMKPIT